MTLADEHPATGYGGMTMHVVASRAKAGGDGLSAPVLCELPLDAIACMKSHDIDYDRKDRSRVDRDFRAAQTFRRVRYVRVLLSNDRFGSSG
jgi:hypothetical protein